MLECWNNGKMGFGTLGCWDNGKIRFDEINKKRKHPYYHPTFQYSTIPLFQD
jgi:hypothetical protein